MKNKIAVKKHPWSSLSKEMIQWLIERDESLKDQELDIHNPLLVQCVEELKPTDFRIVEIDGDEYLTLETLTDVIVIVPEDLEVFKKCFVKIPEECQKKQDHLKNQDEQQD